MVTGDDGRRLVQNLRDVARNARGGVRGAGPPLGAAAWPTARR
ncbi:MAG: hypothetical protein U0838_06560 [Chloroflexota bacterium]